jgi:hypothetical protein
MASTGTGNQLGRARRGLGTAALTALWLLVWTIAVTYDLRAGWLLSSLGRYVRYPIDPTVAALFPQPLPDDPAAIEDLVDARLPYARDIEVWGVPWYFATPRQALSQGRGDCEAYAMVLASLLAAKGITYRVRASFSHMWVEYAGRPESPGESAAEAVLVNVDGAYRFRMPALLELGHHLREQKWLHWDGLAPLRQALLLAGWPVILICVPRARRRSRNGSPTA